MITKYYEMACDTCGGGDYFNGNREISVEHFKDMGWIFVKGKHFCSNTCKQKHFELLRINND